MLVRLVKIKIFLFWSTFLEFHQTRENTTRKQSQDKSFMPISTSALNKALAKRRKNSIARESDMEDEDTGDDSTDSLTQAVENSCDEPPTKKRKKKKKSSVTTLQSSPKIVIRKGMSICAGATRTIMGQSYNKDIIDRAEEELGESARTMMKSSITAHRPFDDEAEIQWQNIVMKFCIEKSVMFAENVMTSLARNKQKKHYTDEDIVDWASRIPPDHVHHLISASDLRALNFVGPELMKLTDEDSAFCASSALGFIRNRGLIELKDLLAKRGDPVEKEEEDTPDAEMKVDENDNQQKKQEEEEKEQEKPKKRKKAPKKVVAETPPKKKESIKKTPVPEPIEQHSVFVEIAVVPSSVSNAKRVVPRALSISAWTGYTRGHRQYMAAGVHTWESLRPSVSCWASECTPSHTEYVLVVPDDSLPATSPDTLLKHLQPKLCQPLAVVRTDLSRSDKLRKSQILFANSLKMPSLVCTGEEGFILSASAFDHLMGMDNAKRLTPRVSPMSHLSASKFYIHSLYNSEKEVVGGKHVDENVVTMVAVDKSGGLVQESKASESFPQIAVVVDKADKATPIDHKWWEKTRGDSNYITAIKVA